MFIFVYDWLVVGEGLILIRSFAGLQDPRVDQSFYKNGDIYEFAKYI